MGYSIALPINSKENDIRQSLVNNQLTIIETPTGSGKTMRVPYLAHLISNKRVHCLVPRVVMAKEAVKGAKITTWNQLWCRGNEVGYATGRGDNFHRKNAQCIYMTEGSFIQRGIANRLAKGSFILIDEVHEQGARTEGLLVQAKSWIEQGLKVVLMSATLDVGKYENFYRKDGISVGVVSLPPKARPFPLEFQTVESPLKAIAQAAVDGGRCLVGVEGKGTLAQSISKLKGYLRDFSLDVPVFPFHGQLEQEELDKPLKHKGAMIVVATNVLQSGVTINGLSHGYFNGLGNRIETNAGRRALKLYDLSQAELTQWFGRIGRTCEGVIFQSEYEANKFSEREEMPTAEILRSPLEETVLMFQSMGMDLKSAGCLNQPKEDSIETAEELLKKLNCLDDENKITQLGKDVFYRGVGLRGGVIEIMGEQFGIANTAKKIATLLGGNHPFRKARYSKYQAIIDGLQWSDHMAWVAILDDIVARYGYSVKSMDKPMFIEESEENGLFRKSLFPLMKSWKYIDKDSEDAVFDKKLVKDAVQKIFKSAYADALVEKSYGSWKTPEGLYPRMANSTQTDISDAECIVGDINIIPTRRGSLTLLEGVTIVK